MTEFDKLQQIFRDIFDDDSLVITHKTSPEDIEDWDSLAQISIISSVQDEFGIELEMGEIAELSDVGSIMNVLKKKQKDN